MISLQFNTNQFDSIAKYSRATLRIEIFDNIFCFISYVTNPISNSKFYFYILRFQSIDFHANDKDFGHSWGLLLVPEMEILPNWWSNPSWSSCSSHVFTNPEFFSLFKLFVKQSSSSSFLLIPKAGSNWSGVLNWLV